MAGLTQTHPTGDRTREPGEGEEATGLVRLEDGTHFLDSSRDVLNEQLAKVVEGLEFPGLQRIIQNWSYRVCLHLHNVYSLQSNGLSQSGPQTVVRGAGETD